MKNKTEDNSVLSHIKKLTEKEEQLYGKENLTDEDVKELHKFKSELDQYWDLLRQRRALRDAGENPNAADMRSNDNIENYEE
jgi:flagellar biosynthesis/type III secretory pathway chaperone